MLVSVAILDRDHLAVIYREGEVKFKDDGAGASAFGGHNSAPEDNWVERFGTLDTVAAQVPGNWTLTSAEDPSYGPGGHAPVKVFRKSKINGMAQTIWDKTANDWHYETTLDHTLYLKLPSPLQEGKRYRLAIAVSVDARQPSRDFVFDSLTTKSEALHVNLVGYPSGATVHAADLYAWLGDGGARDYAAFAGADVLLCESPSGAAVKAGTVKFWKPRGEDLGHYDLTGSDVWTTDFGPAPKPGTYRIAIRGIGCSPDFHLGAGIYEQPFKVAVRGFYYMRIGEAERPDIRPVPRQPRFIPHEDPPECRVMMTTMTPYHPEWKTFSRGDTWDVPNDWARFQKPGAPENRLARGGHSDALDWDRHLGHVSIIYDMLYPFVLTGGALRDDNTGIAESGNGIPDLLDEARNEVDFWLSLRDGKGYGHGLTNPNQQNILYQAGTTAIAAWANAANCAMLADCFRLAGQDALKQEYLAHAVTAYAYAGGLADPQLAATQNVGNSTMRGADFKMTAAAYLFNLTGKSEYEDAVHALSLAVTDTADVAGKETDQIWATAGYLLSPHPGRYPDLRDRMKKGILSNAESMESSLSAQRPSRRSCTEASGYFHTSQDVHRAMLAHRLTDDPAAKQLLLNALLLEADWGLGRNPLNMIQMTTATTPLASRRSVQNAYTSGRNDGTPGMHPGHTPYFNMDDWGGAHGLIMARPRWMAARGYPVFEKWPRGECAFNTRWVWAHAEFTPQQTMRGKMALYGYLYGIDRGGSQP